MSRRLPLAGLFAVALLLAACSSRDDGEARDDSSEAADLTTTTEAAPDSSRRTPTVEVAVLEGPITVGQPSFPADPRPVDLAAAGYEEEEWFASGKASASAVEEELPADGRWTATPTTTAPYKTRLVVRRHPHTRGRCPDHAPHGRGGARRSGHLRPVRRVEPVRRRDVVRVVPDPGRLLFRDERGGTSVIPRIPEQGVSGPRLGDQLLAQECVGAVGTRLRLHASRLPTCSGQF